MEFWVAAPKQQPLSIIMSIDAIYNGTTQEVSKYDFVFALCVVIIDIMRRVQSIMMDWWKSDENSNNFFPIVAFLLSWNAFQGRRKSAVLGETGRVVPPDKTQLRQGVDSTPTGSI